MKYILALFLLYPYFAMAHKGDTLEYYFDYFWQKCNVEKAHFYRMVYKEDAMWRVKDFYLKEGTLQNTGLFSNKNFDTGWGMHYWYHPNGKLSEKGRYIAGKKDGVWKTYAFDGALVDSGFFRNDTGYNVHFAWFADGNLRKRGIFDKDGAGLETTYFKNGKVNYIAKYIAGNVPDSTWVYYYPSGEVSCMVYYKSGKETGYKCFRPDGKSEPCYDGMRFSNDKQLADAFQRLKRKLYLMHFRDFTSDDLGIRLCFDENGASRDLKIVHEMHPSIDTAVLNTFEKMSLSKPPRLYNRPTKICFDVLITFQTGYDGLEMLQPRFGNEEASNFSCECDQP